MRLFPELEVDDPMLEPEKFVREVVPTMLVAESSEGTAPSGYAYFQLMNGVAYVRHLITAPGARRTGVGQALLAAIVDRARDAGCTTWCLNVKPDNAAAITLYERVGMTRAFTSKALVMTWSAVESAGHLQDARIAARIIEPADDALVEPTLKLMNGQLAIARGHEGRILVGLFDASTPSTPVGATVFDPSFPGAYPFRVARPELAFTLLRAIRPYARPGDAIINVVTEGQPEVAEALLAAGATLKLDIQHMKGPLPGPRGEPSA